MVRRSAILGRQRVHAVSQHISSRFIHTTRRFCQKRQPSTQAQAECPSRNDLKYYLKNGGSCTLYTGIVIYVVCLPSCYCLAKYGVADQILGALRSSLNYCKPGLGTRLVDSTRTTCAEGR